MARVQQKIRAVWRNLIEQKIGGKIAHHFLGFDLSNLLDILTASLTLDTSVSVNISFKQFLNKAKRIILYIKFNYIKKVNLLWSSIKGLVYSVSLLKLNIISTFDKTNPPASEASREAENFIKRQNRFSWYGVK